MSPDPKTVREIAREAVRRGGSDSGYDFIGSVISDHAAMDEVLASGDRAAFGRLHAAVRAELKGATVTVSWPDEQQPADVVTAEQQHERIVPELTEELLRTLPVPIAAAIHQLKLGRDNQRRRAEQAELRQREVLAELRAEREDREADVAAEQQQDGAVGRVERFLDAREARGDARNGGTISVVHADGSRTGEGPGMYRRPLTDADLRAVLAERTALAERVAELEAGGAGRLAQAFASGWCDAIEAHRAPGWAEREAAWRKYCETVRIEDGPQQPAQGGGETDGSGEPPACPDCGHRTASHYLGDNGKHGCALCDCPEFLFNTQRES